MKGTDGHYFLAGVRKTTDTFFLLKLDLLIFYFLLDVFDRLSLGVLVVLRLTYPVFVRVYQSLHHGS